MKESEVNIEFAQHHGLTEDEFNRIVALIGRKPTYTELGMFSVMWSEHCSYKNSIEELKKLPRSGSRLLANAGEENAGLVDIGDGLAVVFKIESHNHPSAVEPYQGAATGVGGIMRDIFTMGARPIAALNSLRFGSIDHKRTQYLMKGIVKGIGDYGNSFGVPTVGGDVFFDPSYNENPLVNAMGVGIVKHSAVAHAIATGEGNQVFIVGSSTGRDGIHGATFASEEITETSEEKRPSVQVGDPFTEKLLLEATLEAIGAGLVVGIQDMGAAGITCSTSEMCARGGSGMDINLDAVPVREKNMTGYEILLSESQERMLLVVKQHDIEEIKQIYRKWDLECRQIGSVTKDGRLHMRYRGEVIADIPAESLVLGGGAPVYIRESREPYYIKQIREFDSTKVDEPYDYNKCLLSLLESPNICSKSWIYTQYDSMVRTNTILYEGSDAAVIHLKGADKALALKTDCNPRYVYLNPYLGAQIAVAESARNVVCVGAMPIAITNCLNFGNPYKPESFWQFKEAVRGIGDACRVLNTPVTGGNVSFYNENPGSVIYPTPVIGMLGEIGSIEDIMTPYFKTEGDVIILLGEVGMHIGGSEYLKVIHGLVSGDAPGIDLCKEKRVQHLCLELIRKRLINSAHDVSDGGLAVALAECCILNPSKHFGVEISIKSDIRSDFTLFGEDQSRIIVSASIAKVPDIEKLSREKQVKFQILGEVIHEKFLLCGKINLNYSQISRAYSESLEKKMEELSEK